MRDLVLLVRAFRRDDGFAAFRAGAKAVAKYTTVRTPYDVTRKWQALAERRRAYYVELYRSGRWRRYYSEDVFLAHMREVMSGVEEWNKILSRWPERDAPAQGPTDNRLN